MEKVFDDLSSLIGISSVLFLQVLGQKVAQRIWHLLQSRSWFFPHCLTNGKWFSDSHHQHTINTIPNSTPDADQFCLLRDGRGVDAPFGLRIDSNLDGSADTITDSRDLRMPSKKIYSVISLFSGAMGLDIGLEQSSRFRTLACVEK